MDKKFKVEFQVFTAFTRLIYIVEGVKREKLRNKILQNPSDCSDSLDISTHYLYLILQQTIDIKGISHNLSYPYHTHKKSVQLFRAARFLFTYLMLINSNLLNFNLLDYLTSSNHMYCCDQSLRDSRQILNFMI